MGHRGLRPLHPCPGTGSIPSLACPWRARPAPGLGSAGRAGGGPPQWGEPPARWHRWYGWAGHWRPLARVSRPLPNGGKIQAFLACGDCLVRAGSSCFCFQRCKACCGGWAAGAFQRLCPGHCRRWPGRRQLGANNAGRRAVGHGVGPGTQALAGTGPAARRSARRWKRPWANRCRRAARAWPGW